MDKLYEKVTEEFLDVIERYMRNEATVKDLTDVEERMSLVWRYNEWKSMKQKLKDSVFEMTLDLFNRINDCERLVKNFEKISIPKSIECDMDGLMANAMMLGRNKAPPSGFEQSNWYVGPFPSIQMVEALKEEPDHP